MEYEKILEKMKSSYDICSKNYYKLFHDDIMKHDFDQKLLFRFLDLMINNPIICDMGCGPAAQYGGFIQAHCNQVHGVDISENNLCLAAGLYPDIHFHCNDMTETDFSESSLDGIVSFYSLFHIPKNKTEDLFKEYFRVLKPEGIILLVTHKGEYENTFSEIWGHKGLSIFANFHKKSELENPCLTAGFETIDIFSKESYYDFPKERLVLFAKKPRESI
jgi:SAM-dependent methyltransferase